MLRLLPGVDHARHTSVRSLLLLAALISCAKPPPQLEPEPISTDRPDFTDGVAIVPVGHLQVESGVTFTHEGDEGQWTLGEALVRLALASRLELRLAVYSFGIEDSSAQRQRGREDVGLGAKYLILEAGESAPRWKPDVGVEVNVSVPTGSTGVRAPHVLPLLKLLTSWRLSDRVDFATNVIVAAVEPDAHLRSEWAASGSLGVSVTDRVGLFGEYFAIGTQSDRWHRLDNLDAGVAVAITRSLQLDARAGVGPSSAGHDYFGGVGLSYRY